jgi:predicted Zn-dependent peptidase
MYEKTSLSNGLRVITAPMSHTRSVTVGVFIGTGSRYEKADRSGISHFIEHVCFKGTERRQTAREISEAIEGVGGILNGGTDKELTIYWCKVPHTHFADAVDVLADMICHSTFDPAELEKERQVIIEEINMCLDSPQHSVDLLIDEVIWPGQAMGRDVAGTKDTVSTISRDDMLAYMRSQYLANNSVVAVAGNVSHQEAVTIVEAALGGWDSGHRQQWYPADDLQPSARFRIERRETEQAHLCLAVRGLPLTHRDRFALDLLNVVLGDGMSSRLFLEIRERRGLAYSIHSYADHYLDTGALTVYAGIHPEQLPHCIEAVLTELRRLKEDSVPENELRKAKEFCKGRLLLRMEDTQSVTGWLGGQETLLGSIRSVEEVVSILESVSASEIRRVAEELFLSEKLNLAVVGPVEEAGLEQLLSV